jgi:lysozyme family protein
MERINKYNKFILESEFESIFDNIFRILEQYDDEKPVTFEWNFNKVDNSTLGRLKQFLSKLSKEKVKEYFYKFLSRIKLLPDVARRTIMINYATIFLLFASLSYLTQDNNTSYDVKSQPIEELVEEFVKLNKESSFKESQKIVSLAEGGYSDDRKDTGNWVDIKVGDKLLKRFIGSKYGISAPILKAHLKRTPTKSDMVNLSQDTALKIYKNKFWKPQHLKSFSNQSVANIIYDGCVNQGISGIKSVLRKVLLNKGINITDNDNPLDSKFIKKMNALDQEDIFDTIKEYRENRYKRASTFDTHGDGWLNRLQKIEFQE